MRHPAFRHLLKFGAAAFLLAALFILPALPRAEGAIIYVKQTGTGLVSGSSWANAYGEAEFINRLKDPGTVAGDEFWIAAGTYRPDLTADRTKSFILKSGVKLYGGFAGTETALDQRDWKTNETLLSGELGGGINSYHVVIANDTDNTTLLDGLWILGGKAESNAPNDRGGGLYSIKGSLVIRNCTFAGNSGLAGGGAIYQELGSPVIENCIIAENTSTNGFGAGILHLDLNSWIKNSTFTENSASEGAALFNYTTTSVITNCTFYDNEATEGAAVYNYDGSNTVITNCTFSQNSATGEGSGIYADASNLTVMNTILWDLGNSEIAGHNMTGTVSDSVVNGGFGGGMRIITSDPKLAALDDNDGPTLTCAIASDSSALNVGQAVGTVVSGTVVVPDVDQRGVDRPQGSGVDIGAYEREVSPTPGGGSGGGCQSTIPVGAAWLMIPLALLLLRRRD